MGAHGEVEEQDEWRGWKTWRRGGWNGSKGWQKLVGRDRSGDMEIWKRVKRRGGSGKQRSRCAHVEDGDDGQKVVMGRGGRGGG